MNHKEDAEAEAVESEDRGVSHSQLVVSTEVLPTTIHLLPVLGRPFFPAQVLPLVINIDPWMETIQEIGNTDQRVVGLVLASDENPANLDVHQLPQMGSVVRMHHPNQIDGKIQFVAEGIKRFRIIRWLSKRPPYLVQVEYPDIASESTKELRAYALAIINLIKELIPLNPLYSEELKSYLERFSPNEPSYLADFAASITSADASDLQEIIESVPLLYRMEKVLLLLKKELEVAQLQTKIRSQVEEQLSEQQRKFFLREQLKVIQKELGIAKDDRTADIETFKKRLTDLVVPENAKKRIDDELQKLSVLESGSPEYGVTRNYLDTLTNLPWGLYSKDQLDLKHARQILERDHDGLDDVKARIEEFLAMGVFKGSVSGSILLLVGPPGVGKTSIGRSIAEALGRKFYRFSVGGMRDEAEIKGHRRTYIGAMPGKFIQAIKETAVANPVIMLDEIDKLNASYQGDPASALLEVLDPEQNNMFLDHYLDVRFDLSKVLFICTANQLDTIPAPLLDRMETIRLAGYISAEKLEIAKRHLWPKQLKKAGVKSKQLKITTPALRLLIEGYAREAGVRSLDQLLARIVRKSVVQILGGQSKTISVNTHILEEYLGPPLFRGDKRIKGVGVVTGLAWTALGGATLPVEAVRVHARSSGIKLTGKLGEVMKESAEIAYSFVIANSPRYRVDESVLENAFIHLHVPEGATPKDGPSAGITMATAILSMAKNKPVSANLAMTGELTLTGHVLPVGGIREKLIAARRSKIKEIILPVANERDFNEVPDFVCSGLKVHFVTHYDEVAKIVFGG